MRVLYNEIDEYCCAWLSNLMDADLIPKGEINATPIENLDPEYVAGFETAHFFAGLGGWPYALRLAGWPDDEPVWTGSCPCQPFSVAGKGAGEEDHRHLWPDFLRLISVAKPHVIFGEQVSGDDGLLWLAGVHLDLEKEAYRVGATDLPAACVTAPHQRQRIWWVADAMHAGRTEWRTIAGNGQITRSGAVGGVGYAEHSKWWSKHEIDTQPHGRDGSRWHGDTLPMADGASTRLEERRGQPGDDGEELDAAERGGDIERLGESDRHGREPRESSTKGNGYRSSTGPDGFTQSIGHAELSERWQIGEIGPTGRIDGVPLGQEIADRIGDASEVGGHWDEYCIIYCQDGKYRRIEPTIFPLASRIPARMGKLRAAGNAIVPQVAAKFIRAYRDVRGW